MTESQIRCFQAVANYRSFSKAASHLMISQPAISHQILKLEQELEIELFLRLGQQVLLTESGRIMLEYFDKTGNMFSLALSQARTAHATTQNVIRIGCPDEWDLSLVAPRVDAFLREEDPRLAAEFIGMHITELAEALSTGQIHAFVSIEDLVEPMPNTTEHCLGHIHDVLFYSVRAEQNALEEPRMEDFQDSTFYLAVPQQRFQRLRQHVYDICEPYGFKPRLQLCSSLAEILFNVQQRKGVFLGDEYLRVKQQREYYSTLTLAESAHPLLLIRRGN